VTSLASLERRIVSCRRCPRLVAHREAVAATKRRAYRDEPYWGRPVPGFGDPRAWLLVVGLAPGAHGANRTGRMLTGDASGDFLYPALHRAGLSNQAESRARGDGLKLRGVFITNAARCVPPANAPAPAELRACAPYLEQEFRLLQPTVVLALGAVAWAASLEALTTVGVTPPRPRPAFAHGDEWRAGGGPVLLACYHVSQQNTRTGRLTAPMLDAVLQRALTLGGPVP
jgi:uracil-DNA glycosylase family 4